MRTSLIIPVLNEEKYLAKLLESVCKQSVIPGEIIIGDNNSTDSGIKIALSFADRLPIMVVKQPIKGITPTVEKIWRMASGDIILKTDADCVLPPFWVQNIISHFEKDEKLSACGGPLFANDGDLFDKLIISLGQIVGFYLLRFIKGYPLLVGGNFAIKKNVLEEVGGYSPQDRLQDDQQIDLKLHKSGYHFSRFWDLWNYTSARRWSTSKLEYLKIILSAFTPKFYTEKSK
jgi:glycosyltransferase involved in cell wall biosynthesis